MRSQSRPLSPSPLSRLLSAKPSEAPSAPLRAKVHAEEKWRAIRDAAGLAIPLVGSPHVIDALQSMGALLEDSYGSGSGNDCKCNDCNVDGNGADCVDMAIFCAVFVPLVVAWDVVATGLQWSMRGTLRGLVAEAKAAIDAADTRRLGEALSAMHRIDRRNWSPLLPIVSTRLLGHACAVASVESAMLLMLAGARLNRQTPYDQARGVDLSEQCACPDALCCPDGSDPCGSLYIEPRKRAPEPQVQFLFTVVEAEAKLYAAEYTLCSRRMRHASSSSIITRLTKKRDDALSKVNALREDPQIRTGSSSGGRGPVVEAKVIQMDAPAHANEAPVANTIGRT